MVGVVSHPKNEGFGPLGIEAMLKALNDVCAVLKIEGDASAREVIAIRIIELAARGEHNSERLRDRLLLEAKVDTGLDGYTRHRGSEGDQVTLKREAVACPKYSVVIDDNWHYMDMEHRLKFGPYSTAEEAVAACRKIVDDWLELYKEPGMTTEALYERYVCFGPDPFVVPTKSATAVDKALWQFSAGNYAEKRAKMLCS